MSNTESDGVLVRAVNRSLEEGTTIPLLGAVGAPGTTQAQHVSREDFYLGALAELDKLHDAGSIELTYRDRYSDLVLGGKTTEQLVEDAEVAGDSDDRLTRLYSPCQLGTTLDATRGGFIVTGDGSITNLAIPKVPASEGKPMLVVSSVTLNWQSGPATGSGNVQFGAVNLNGDAEGPLSAAEAWDATAAVVDPITLTADTDMLNNQRDNLGVRLVINNTTGSIELYSILVEYVAI